MYNTKIKLNHLRALQVSSDMNIETTKNSITALLEYKKEASKKLLSTTDKDEVKQLIECINYANTELKKILGICEF